MNTVDQLLEMILTVAHEQAIEVDDADQKARIETWQKIQEGDLRMADFEPDTPEYDAALTKFALAYNDDLLNDRIACVNVMQDDLHWLLSLFHMRHDDTGWRVVMHEYPPSPEDAQRIGELAARYGVAVSVAQNAAPEPEPLPDAPAGDDVEPMARFDTLANGRRHDAVD